MEYVFLICNWFYPLNAVSVFKICYSLWGLVHAPKGQLKLRPWLPSCSTLVAKEVRANTTLFPDFLKVS